MATAELDYYEVLGVARDADDQTIKSAYRKLAVQLHPDKNGGCKDAEASFKAVNEAYDCLKDPQKRAAYDRFGKAGLNGHGGGHANADMHGFADIFEGIFGDFMGRQGRGGRTVHRGQDLRYDLELTLDEAFRGKTATIELAVTQSCDGCAGTGAKPGTQANSCGTCGGRGQVRTSQGFFVIERSCPTCAGSGQVIADPCRQCRGLGRVERERKLEVNIPAGVDDGTRIRLAGEGESGLRGGPAGDLYLFIHLRPHRLFKREGTTLFAEVPVSMTTAALGGEIDVPGLDGEPCSVKIPAGTQPGKQFRVRGRGMPVLGSPAQRGDLVIELEIETPVKLTKRQRELLEEFQAIERDHSATSPKSHGFFGRLKDWLSDERPAA
ncbi:MAG: molecular chaperone DnaJ [Sphingomonadaceae bacterium]|nr:molecular chaperone DnaJ [Sphingomonadaceae bacterium]